MKICYNSYNKNIGSVFQRISSYSDSVVTPVSSLGWTVVFQRAGIFPPRVTREHSYISLSLNKES